MFEMSKKGSMILFSSGVSLMGNLHLFLACVTHMLKLRVVEVA